MIVELNPLKWGKKAAPAVTAASAPAEVEQASSVAKAEEKSGMANKFVGFLETVGKDFLKGLGVAVQYAPAASALAGAIFPPAIAVAAPATAALNLIQNAVISIEQKYAASNVQSGTGPQKAAEVLTLAGPAATQLLTQAGVPAVDDAYIGDVISAVVGVLNAKAAPAAATA